MKSTATRNVTKTLKPPANWNEEKDGKCGDLEVRIELFGESRILNLISTYKPSPEELAHLNRGGVIEVSILSAAQPPIALSVVDPVGYAPVTGYDEHGVATP